MTLLIGSSVGLGAGLVGGRGASTHAAVRRPQNGSRRAGWVRSMDIATGLGLLAGATVVVTLMLMGGGLGMFVSDHAVIIIFGGSFAATLIRFPLSSIFHGLPLGMKFVFTMRRISQRELVDEIAGLAEIDRKSTRLNSSHSQISYAV